MNRKIKAQDVSKLLLRVYKKYLRGDIDESKAYREAFLLNSVLRAVETAELEERISNIEETLKDK
jgi:hypothetical protein